ncbi:MAG: hypothetical protein ACSLFI_04425 [Solirubrobacterales bacterium]
MAMVVSIFATLYFGRGTTFSGDELVLVVTSPDFDLRTAFQPHAGHLVVIPRLVYYALLNLFGLDYLPYRILTVLSVCLTVGLLFTWLIRRVPRLVALVPCLILLFFGTDHLHMLQGNGFIICFSLAMGLLAILMAERGDLLGDVFACGSLLAAVATYSVGLPFVGGVAVLVLLSREWRRLWVPLLPLLAYVCWLAWSKRQGFAGGGAEFSSIAGYPAWVFQASGASIYGLTGLSFDWSGGKGLDLVDWRAAILSTLLIASVILCVWRGRSTRALWVAVSIGLGLWGLQVIVSSSGDRLPNDARFLYPGAVSCVLILGAAAQGLRWRKSAMAVLYVVGAIGLTANVVLLERNGDYYRDRAVDYKVTSGLAELNLAALLYGVSSIPEPVAVDGDFEATPTNTFLLMAGVPYGDFAISPDDMLLLPEDERLEIDSRLAEQLGVKRSPVEGSPDGKCVSARADGMGQLVLEAPKGNVIVSSGSGVSDLKLGRFADELSVSLGRLRPDRPAEIRIPPDQADIPWRLGGSGANLEVCSSSSN